jgi:cytochrome c biogenesis protein ResB
MLTRLIKYLSSLRCTLLLLVALMAVFLTGFFVPQRSVMGKGFFVKWEASAPLLAKIDALLHFTEVFTAPITLVLWGLFFLNLLLVMKQRIPLILRKVAIDEKAVGRESASGFKYSIQLADGAAERIPGVLTGAGYLFLGAPERFYSVKNRLSPLATLVFHLSFFLLLLGWLVVFYTKFNGLVDLSIGEPFLGQVARYNPSPMLPKLGGAPEVKFIIDSIQPEMAEGVHTGMTIALRDEAGTKQELGINRPYKTGHASVLFNDLGIAPLFVLQDSSGKEVDGAFVKLDVLKGKQDHFAFLGYTFLARYYPDHFVAANGDQTRSEEFKNPAFHIEVSKNGSRLAERTLHPGDAIEFDGYRLTFREQTFWARLMVTAEYGREFIYAGFILALIALVWRLVYYRREISGSVQVVNGAQVLKLSARSDFYQALAQDEFDRTVAGFSALLGSSDLPASISAQPASEGIEP